MHSVDAFGEIVAAEGVRVGESSSPEEIGVTTLVVACVADDAAPEEDADGCDDADDALVVDDAQEE